MSASRGLAFPIAPMVRIRDMRTGQISSTLAALMVLSAPLAAQTKPADVPACALAGIFLRSGTHTLSVTISIKVESNNPDANRKVLAALAKAALSKVK